MKEKKESLMQKKYPGTLYSQGKHPQRTEL